MHNIVENARRQNFQASTYCIERICSSRIFGRFACGKFRAAGLPKGARIRNVGTIVMIALMTAQRGVGIKELKWEHVDFERNIIWFPAGRSKLKNRVTTPMQPALAAHLDAARQAAQSEWVVEWRGGPVASVRKSFQALVKRAGLKDVTFHDLRRTAASLAVQRGASFAEVAALLGDDEAVVRRHYAMFDPQFLSGILSRIDAIAYAPVARIGLTPIDESNPNPSDTGTQGADIDQ